jgi:uncharacterized RDD family membrane protein YckC
VNVGQIGPVYVPESAAPEVATAVPQLATVPARPAFAGFWRRAIACIIDTLIVVTIFVLAASLFPSSFDKLVPPAPVSLTALPQPSFLLIVVMAGLVCAYYTIFEASIWQATPGKRMLRLYVTDLNGKRITYGRALVRNLARQLSGIFFIGFMLAGFTEKKQALHDILAGSLVLRRP